MMIASLYRRALLGGSVGVLATLSSLPASADQITFVSQGGAYQKAQTVAILDPAAKKLGITINQDSIPDAWPAVKSLVAWSGRAAPQTPGSSRLRRSCSTRRNRDGTIEPCCFGTGAYTSRPRGKLST